MPRIRRLDESRLRAIDAVSGAWDVAHQHTASALGLLAHAVQLDRDRRRNDGLLRSRLSHDILGTAPVDVVDIG
jgi:hypothetical protein